MVRRDDLSEERYSETRRRVLARYEASGSFHLLEFDEPPLRLELLESGRGADVLYLHGHGGTGLDPGPLLGSMGEQFRVWAPTRPGSGLSSKIDYKNRDLRTHALALWTTLLDELDIDRVPVIGTSLGGLEAVWLALDHPERVERVVLLGGPAGFDRWAPAFYRLSSVSGVNRLLHATLARPGPRNTERLLEFLVANPDRVPEEFREHMTANTTMPGWRRSWLSLVEEAVTLGGFRRRYYVGDEVSAIEQPVLFVWGEQDSNVPIETGRELAGTISDARFEAISDAGHLPWLDQPERCAELITDFLAE